MSDKLTVGHYSSRTLGPGEQTHAGNPAVYPMSRVEKLPVKNERLESSEAWREFWRRRFFAANRHLRRLRRTAIWSREPGWQECKLCYATWRLDEPEQHWHDCPLAAALEEI